MVVGNGCCGMRVVVGVVVVVMVVVSTVTALTSTGKFQMHESCGSEVALRSLVVRRTMWIRTGDQEALLSTWTNQTCLLPLNTTVQVKAEPYIRIYLGDETDTREGKELCSFPKQDLELDKGILKVSCIIDRKMAEEEMLRSPELLATTTTEASTSTTTLVTSVPSPASPATPLVSTDTSLDSTVPSPGNTATSPARNVQLPVGRSMGLPSPRSTTQSTKTTVGPKSRKESLVVQSTLSSAASTGRTSTSTSMGTPEKSTPMVTQITTTSTKHSLTKEVVVTVTTPVSLSETSTGLVTEVEATTEALFDGTPQATPGSSGTHEAEHEGIQTTGLRRPGLKKENISAPASVMLSNTPNTDGDDSDDHMVYLAGVGAGVLALVLAVVVVASVAYHRRRQARMKAAKQDLFMSGTFKGSMNSLTHTGSGTERGAYLNAHVMYYSGAQPEVAESFELEERILNSSGISYSSHDIPKCLK